MPYFRHEKWYLEQVRHALVDGRLKDQEKIKASYQAKSSAINNLLAEGLLGHPGRMEEIAENGYLAAKEGHTWLQRAEFIYAKYLQG